MSEYHPVNYTTFYRSRYFIGKFLIFVFTLYITVYLTSTIADNLHKHKLELALANMLLQKHDKVKSKYILVLTHDIKADLSSIQSCLMVVTHGITGSISKKSREMISRAERRSKKLLEFVNDLHFLSILRSSENLIMDDLNLLEIAREEWETVQKTIIKKGVEASIAVEGFDFFYTGNEFLVRKMFMHLLQNAASYTPNGGKIHFRLKENRQKELFHILICNTGERIPEENIIRIFDDFFKGSNIPENGRNGLGLALVKQIVNIHGGKVQAAWDNSSGNIFEVVFPWDHTKR